MLNLSALRWEVYTTRRFGREAIEHQAHPGIRTSELTSTQTFWGVFLRVLSSPRRLSFVQGIAHQSGLLFDLKYAGSWMRKLLVSCVLEFFIIAVKRLTTVPGSSVLIWLPMSSFLQHWRRCQPEWHLGLILPKGTYLCTNKIMIDTCGWGRPWHNVRLHTIRITRNRFSNLLDICIGMLNRENIIPHLIKPLSHINPNGRRQCRALIVERNRGLPTK